MRKKLDVPGLENIYATLGTLERALRMHKEDAVALYSRADEVVDDELYEISGSINYHIDEVLGDLSSAIEELQGTISRAKEWNDG